MTLIGQLSEVAADLTRRQLAIMQAGTAVEFAAVVRATADKLAEQSAGWAAMSSTIRESWSI